MLGCLPGFNPIAQATTTGVSEEVTVDVTSDQTESQTDYDKRMAINAKMRFYRSLNSC